MVDLGKKNSLKLNPAWYWNVLISDCIIRHVDRVWKPLLSENDKHHQRFYIGIELLNNPIGIKCKRIIFCLPISCKSANWFHLLRIGFVTWENKLGLSWAKPSLAGVKPGVGINPRYCLGKFDTRTWDVLRLLQLWNVYRQAKRARVQATKSNQIRAMDWSKNIYRPNSTR